MKPWKSQRGGSVLPAKVGLQWGHGDEAVEEAVNWACVVHGPEASMGPRR